MSNKKYFWLKLKDDFFKTKDIRKLRMVAGGDTFTIIYLKMQLLSIRNEGIIEFIGIEDSIEEQLALELDEKIDDVKLTLAFLFHNRMIEQLSEEEYLLNAVVESIGSETTAAERMRRLREKRSNSVTMLPDVQESYTEIDIEIEKEIELDKEKENKPKKVDDTPCIKKPYTVKPYMDKPYMDKPYMDNQYTNNNSINNNSINNNSNNNNSSNKDTLSVSKEDKDISDKDLQAIIDKWNSVGLNQVTKVSKNSTLGGYINARLKENGLEEVFRIIDVVPTNKLLMGEATDWRCNFDWIMKKSNFEKVQRNTYPPNRKEETDGEYQQFIYDDGSRNEEDNRPSPADVLRAAIEAAEAKERNE